MSVTLHNFTNLWAIPCLKSWQKISLVSGVVERISHNTVASVLSPAICYTSGLPGPPLTNPQDCAALQRITGKIHCLSCRGLVQFSEWQKGFASGSIISPKTIGRLLFLASRFLPTLKCVTSQHFLYPHPLYGSFSGRPKRSFIRILRKYLISFVHRSLQIPFWSEYSREKMGLKGS